MHRVVWRWGWTAVLGSGLLAGCEHTGAFQRYPPDPLFVRAKPVAGRPSAAVPALARSEPIAPALPPSALVKRPSSFSNPPVKVEPADPAEPIARIPSSVGILTGRDGKPVAAIPAVRTRELLPLLDRT